MSQLPTPFLPVSILCLISLMPNAFHDIRHDHSRSLCLGLYKLISELKVAGGARNHSAVIAGVNACGTKWRTYRQLMAEVQVLRIKTQAKCLREDGRSHRSDCWLLLVCLSVCLSYSTGRTCESPNLLYNISTGIFRHLRTSTALTEVSDCISFLLLQIQHIFSYRFPVHHIEFFLISQTSEYMEPLAHLCNWGGGLGSGEEDWGAGKRDGERGGRLRREEEGWWQRG